MFTRTIHSVKILSPLFIALALAVTTTTSAFSQSYHHPITVDPAMPDSIETPHLQVSLLKVENENMKFRLAASNPASRFMIITIQKGDDVFFSQNVRQDKYDYVFDLSSLEDGNYELTITNGKERISKNILIQTATHVNRELSVD